MSEQDPYVILGLPPNATDQEIRKAYISRCKVLHPDRFDPKTQPKEWAQANEMHAELNRAYATLRNASQQPGADAQASATQGQAASPNSTPSASPAPHRSKRPFIDGRAILLMVFVGLWGLYLGATSLWRESGIDKVPHHLSLTELRDGTVPNNRLLKLSDAECDLGHGVAYLEHYTPQAYYIPLVTPSGQPESETPPSGRRIILRLTKKLYDAHSGALQNAGAPLTVEGIRLLNTDVESRIEEFLKKELGIANLDNVVVIDGGRRPVGALLPIKVLIISTAWLLMLFFNFAEKPKLAWSAIAVLCGAFAIVPDRLSLEPDYESPLASQALNTDTITPRGLHLGAPVTPPTQPRSEKNTIASRFEKLRKAAAQGDAEAQSSLGRMYAKGDGVSKDAVEAVQWFRKAAEQGYARAQYNLGVMYERGDGVSKHSVEALKWYRKAAAQGYADAQSNLGVMYASGNGVSKDAVEAAKWFRKAAEQGDADAQRNLGVMYAHGNGISKDATEAVKWYRKAAEQGDASAQYNLGIAYHEGNGIERNAVESARWARKSAEQGNAFGQVLLGIVLDAGIGVSKDEIEALAWYYVAAASGYEGASKLRTSAEQSLGQQASLLAQQRSKEILKRIQTAKANSAQAPKLTPPGETDRETAPGPGQSGTGVFVTADGLILTAAHVVEGTFSIRIQTSQGVKPGRLVKVDTKNDLALIKCEGSFQPVPVKESRVVKLGQAVFTIGFPNVELQGVSPKMTRGEISSLAGLQDDPRHWQISVPVQPGNSGGPLFDEAGNVIGVIVAKLNAIKAAKFTGDLSQNVNYAVKSAPALKLLAPYSEKLARERQVNPSDKVETVVEQCRESVVLIFGYGP